MENRWEKFNGVSSGLLDILSKAQENVKLNAKEGDTYEDVLEKYQDELETLEKGLADIESDKSLAEILTPAEKEKLRKILKTDKDFSSQEKFILYMLLGIQPDFQLIGDYMGISKPGIKKICDRAMAKIVDIQKREGKDFIDAMKRELQNKKIAQADGRYEHKGNVRGMERPGWKDSEHNPANN